MKIAMIGHKRIPSREGGVEIVVEALATRLVKMGHQVDAYNRSGENVLDSTVEVEKRKEYEGIRIITVPTCKKRSLNALVYSVLATFRALFGGYDAIHYHAEGPCAMLLIPHLLGKRTIATIHGLDWQRGKWGRFASRYLKFGEKIAAKYADEVIVLSRNVQQYFWEEYGRITHYIPNGVEEVPSRKANIIKEKYGLEKNSYLLFLGRLVPEKGVHYLIEAYKSIKGDKPKLVIAGAPSHSPEYYEELCERMAGENNIITTGFVQGEELEELYSNCLAYVLPSDVEGMPISLLEAMSYGCPCLVSDIDEIAEIVEEEGYYFKHGDVSSLEKTLRSMLKELSGAEGSAKNRSMDKHDWDKIAEKHVRMYRKENGRFWERTENV